MNQLFEQISLRKFVYWSLLVFIAGFFFFPKSKPHNTAYYALVLAPYLLSLRRADLVEFWQSSIFRLIVIFLVYLTLSLAWGEITSSKDWSKYTTRLLYLLGFSGMIITYYSKEYLTRISLLTASVAVVMAAVSMLIYDSSAFPPPDRLKNFGILEHEILAASTYGFAALLLIYGISPEQHWPKHWLWLKLIGLCVLLADILQTQSRGPLLALLCSILIAELLIGRRRKLITGAIMLGLLAVGVMLAGWVEAPAYLTRNGGDSYRFEIWSLIWQRIMDAPWFGLGLSADETVFHKQCGCIAHPHNIFLSTLFYGGVVGLVLLLSLIALSLKSAFKQFQQHQNVQYLALLLFGILCGLTDGNKLIHHPKPMWIYFWMPMLLIAAQQIPQRLQQRKNGQA